jgi:uncharacterized membrane protein YhaH (DUF805 family)
MIVALTPTPCHDPRMNPVAQFVSPAGRLAPGPFMLAVVIVYVLSFASQLLLSTKVMPGVGLWAFALAQLALLWGWYSLHARRLRDAGRSTGLAAGIAIVYALAVLLFLLVLGFLQVSGDPSNPQSDLLMAWFAFAYVLGMLYSAADFGAVGLILAAFALIALAPFVLAVGFSIWAATLPSAASPS